MPDLITLTCPSCGAKLKVTDEIHLLLCRNCGNEHMVVRNADMMYLAPMAQDVKGIRVGVDKTAAELAVARLGKEIADIEESQRAAAAMLPDQIIPAGPFESLLKALGSFFVIVFVISLCASQSQFTGWLALVLVVATITFFVTEEKRRTRARKLRQGRIDQLQAGLDAKREQYKKNRQIAES